MSVRASWKTEDSPRGRGQNKKHLVFFFFEVIRRRRSVSAVSPSEIYHSVRSYRVHWGHVPSCSKTLEDTGKSLRCPCSRCHGERGWHRKPPRVWNVERGMAVLWGMRPTGAGSCYSLLHPFNLPWPPPQRRGGGRGGAPVRLPLSLLCMAGDRRRPP